MDATQEQSPIDVPVIDISGYVRHDDIQTREIVRQLSAACQSPGFFQITGHNVPRELQFDLLCKFATFFALPAETKQAIHRNKSPCQRGYEGVGDQHLEGDHLPDQKEGFTIGPERDEVAGFLRGPNQWPSEEEVPYLRELFMQYFQAMQALSKTVFRLIALSLDLNEDYFDDFVTGDNAVSLCRVNRYPPVTEDQATETRGIGAHTDFGALTLLLQDTVGGLEVFHKPSRTWHSVRPVSDAFVVNIGDMLERWTNKKYTSTLHRAHSPTSGTDRYSIAFFNEGVMDQVIECIPSCLGEGDESLFEPITAEEHLRARYSGSY